MEIGNGGASSKGGLIPVPDSSDIFKNSVLAPLQSAYLYDESRQFFRYKSAVLVKNPTLERKYNAFRAKRREAGYSEEDLEESYGFLLFDDINKANALGETGVLAGSSTCTTLGDPSKGVYISMNSDCLDLNRWYHGKSGYIAIIRLTKGKVKKVSENYTQNFTAPTVGFDCHVSEQLPSVSAQTSSFLAFERTQCYMYELLDDASNATAWSPSAACPFAILSFSYTDTKATIGPPQEKCDEKKAVFSYLPWRGQLEIGSQLYNIGLRSTTGALIPAKLPPVVKVDRAISMLDLRQLLPKAVFETCFAGEAFLDGLYCSLCELVSTEAEETNSLAQLVWEIREKDLALAVLLSDGGFLILLHSSHFLTYDDAWPCATEVLQGLFVFPDSRVVMKDTKFGQKKPSMTSEILQILPVLSYAEGEVEKTSIDPSEELCEVLAQHMQSYTALINPGLASSPSREVSMFPFQYDVPDAHLYSSPEWTDRAMQSFRSYLSRPVSFQLPVSRASEILAAGQEERRREDLDDDVYICISSPEEAPQVIDPVSTVLEDTLSDLNSPETIETSVENGRSSPGAKDDLTVVPRNVVTNDLQPGHLTKGNEKCSNLSEQNKSEGVNNVTPPRSDDLPAELIVSITSAEQSVSDETLNLRAKLQAAEVNSLCDETDYTKKLLDIPKVTSFTGTKLKMHTRLSKGSNKVSKASVEPSSLQTVKTPVEVDSLNIQKDEHTKDLSDHPQLRNPSNWRKLQRRKRKCGKLSTKSRKLRSGIVALPIAEEKKTDPGLQNVESTILVELEVCPLRRKTERWDLKPIISECGRILVPHGATDFTDQIKFLKDKLQATKNEQSPEKTLLDALVDADDTVILDPESCTAPETAVEEMEAAESVDGGNDLQNITAGDVNPELNISKQLDIVNSLLPLNPASNSSKNDHTDTLPSQAFQEKHSDNLSPEKSPTKCEFLLRKLKSVLLKGKRKVDLVTGDTTPNTLQDTEPCLKKNKEVDSETEVLKSNDTNTLSTDAAVKEVPKMLPVDLRFAFALGLTPKVIPEKVTKTEDRDTPQKLDPTKTQEQMISDKQSQIIHRPPSIFTRRGRIKTLKKHQSISAECIKKKWWLHFQTPACFASEKLKYKDSTSDNSVRKTEKTVNSAYSSADALNLLADLALSANNDQVPPQPKPSFEREPETSLKKSDLKKELTSAEQESVLHALLRQPASRATEPHESPAPSHLICELVGLVSKEHAYSLPPSSSLLLGLPGTSPVSDSPGLLHHDQPMSGIKTLQPTVDQEDRSEHNKTPEYLKKHMVRKQKFRYSRTFVNKEGSIKVTRHWQENYDFNLDSKFTSDSKDKTIIRALHGPWDLSIQDTNEEVRLIVHMWIGLFYSRSTPRFFHVEPNFSYLSLEESDSLEMVSTPARSEHLATALASVPSVTDTSDPLNSTALDLSKKDEDQDSVVLDLSLRNSSACSESLTSPPQVNKKGTFESSEQKEPSETLNSVKLPRQLYEHSGKMVNSKVNLTDVINVKKPHEGEKTSTPRKTLCLQSTDIPSFEDDGKVIPLQKVTDCASIKPNAPLAALGIGQVLHGCNEEKTNKKDGTENSGPKERSLVKQDVMDSFKFVKHEKNIEAEDVVQADEHEKNKSKNLAICEKKEDPYQKGNADPSQKVARVADDSAKESDIFCNGNCLESEKLLSREEHKAVSQEQHENFKEVLVCGPKYKGEVMKDDRLDEKDDCISALKADKDLAHQPLPEKCNGLDLVNQNFITQSNHQAQMNEQPSLTNNTKDVCRDLLDANMLCSDPLVQDYSVSEKVSHTPFGIKSVNTESAAKDISKKAIYLRNEALKTAVFPLSTPQTKDNVEMKSQNKERSDFSTAQSDHEDQDNKSAEEVLKDDTEQFQHQPDSPQCELLKACEAQVSFTKETDLRTDETNEALDKNCTGVEIPFIGIESSGEDTVRAKDDNAADKQFQHQPHSLSCTVPKMSEAQLGFMGKTDVRIDKTNEGLDKCCTGIEIPFVGIDGSGEDTVQAKDDNATHKKTFQHQSHSPQHEFPKICEAQVTFAKETDLRTDETNEALDKNCTGIEIPFIGIESSGEDTVRAKDDNAADKQFQHQPHSLSCKVPKMSEAQLGFMGKTDVRIDKTNEGLDKCCTGIEIPFVGIDGSGEDTVQAKDDNATHKKTFQHQSHSPQHEFPKICEAQVTFAKETDLRTDETNEALDKNCTGVESLFTGLDSPGEDTVQIKDNNAADEQFQHQPHSPQCKVPKMCEAQLAFTEKTDVRIDKTNKGLDKCCTGVEIPFVGIDGSGEDTVQAKDDNATHKKTFQHQSHSPQCEFPKIFEAQVTSTKENDLRTEDTNEALDKNCTGVEIAFVGIDGSGEDTVQAKDDNATHKKTFQHQSHSPQHEFPKIYEAQVTFAKETDLRTDYTNEGLDKNCTGVEIPLIGIDSSGGDTVQVKDYSATDEQFQHQPHSPQSEVLKIFEAQVHSTKETVLRAEKTNEGLDKSCAGVEIPLIGIKSSGEDTVQPHGSLPHDGGEEVVQSQEEIPFISDSSDPKSALPDEVHSISQECSKQVKPCEILLLDVNERYRPVDLGSESDDRSPTPTIDEKPYGCLPRSSPSSSTSAFSGTETAKNLNHKILSTVSAPVNGELPCEQKICHTSIFNTDSSPHQVFHPDLEARTQRVLQSIDKFLSTSDYTDKSCPIQTPKMKECVDQSPNPSSKCIPSSLSFKDKKIGNNKPAAVPGSVSQDLRKESSEHLLVSPFKNKLEEVLGVKLHLKKTDSAPQNYFERVNIQENSVGQDSHSYNPPSTELLQVIKPSLDPERPKSTLQSSINHEPRPFSHRPVMAVKPSKNDESQADFFSIDVHTEKPLKSKPPKTPRLAYSRPKSILSEKRTKEKSRRHSERLDDNQEACQLSFKNTWLPDVDNSKSNSVESKFGLLDLSYQCQRKDISKFNTIPSSSPSVQSSESAESSSKLVDGVQCFLINGSVEKEEQTVKKSIEMDLKDSSSASASFMSQRDDDSIDEGLILGPQSSLVCTVYNNSRKRSYSFLEQVSQRCLQDDLTQASVEQECLIFSEQMKQVLKKSARWSIHQEDIHDNMRPSCSSPMTINFSNLDEQEDSLDQLGASLIGQKIKVDLSDRNDSTEKTEEDMLRPGEQSQGKENSVEHDWVSDVTAECARLYEAKMHHVCAFKNISSRAKHFRKNYTKTEPGNHFDFCDQMKKEMDKTFRTSLNSVVKKSCRTKYRFYILATSDDVFFEQTKAQLEAEGHTAIQPSDFFLGEDSSSSSIIIIRNEDIAEHICKVPHLLELKKSPSVQFAGIDEPDDVVNLTHQELFTQGGFIMFNRSTLDALSLCKMKKVSKILLELSKMGKWKWMLHYRDSRRIKENARLSAEAKEKKHFLYWGQDAGLLEVLPYHECDQMSKDQPEYLACLIRLQVQKISSRYPVFITDAAVDSGFEKNGILTMTSNLFLTKPLSEMFTV